MSDSFNGYPDLRNLQALVENKSPVDYGQTKTIRTSNPDENGVQKCCASCENCKETVKLCPRPSLGYVVYACGHVFHIRCIGTNILICKTCCPTEQTPKFKQLNVKAVPKQTPTSQVKKTEPIRPSMSKPAKYASTWGTEQGDSGVPATPYSSPMNQADSGILAKMSSFASGFSQKIIETAYPSVLSSKMTPKSMINSGMPLDIMYGEHDIDIDEIVSDNVTCLDLVNAGITFDMLNSTYRGKISMDILLSMGLTHDFIGTKYFPLDPLIEVCGITLEYLVSNLDATMDWLVVIKATYKQLRLMNANVSWFLLAGMESAHFWKLQLDEQQWVELGVNKDFFTKLGIKPTELKRKGWSVSTLDKFFTRKNTLK